jgi:GT2 family glycosyltransferase
MATVDILVPTNNRLTSLIMTLSSIASQTLYDLHVIIADQSSVATDNEPVIQAIWRIIEARGGQVSYHPPSRSRYCRAA